MMSEKVIKLVNIMEKTVLVVDNDQDIVRLITESLIFEQFKAIPSYSGNSI